MRLERVGFGLTMSDYAFAFYIGQSGGGHGLEGYVRDATRAGVRHDIGMFQLMKAPIDRYGVETIIASPEKGMIVASNSLRGSEIAEKVMVEGLDPKEAVESAVMSKPDSGQNMTIAGVLVGPESYIIGKGDGKNRQIRQVRVKQGQAMFFRNFHVSSTAELVTRELPMGLQIEELEGFMGKGGDGIKDYLKLQGMLLHSDVLCLAVYDPWEKGIKLSVFSENESRGAYPDINWP